jgi:hypothetical protein
MDFFLIQLKSHRQFLDQNNSYLEEDKSGNYDGLLAKVSKF